MNLPFWSVLPFLAVLCCVAILPALTPRFWRKHQILVLSVFAMPILSLSAAVNFHWVTQAFVDYVNFICLLGALYTIGGGLYVQGTPKANPVSNLMYMAFGALLASFIGTLGASMLLIRPLLRSNRGRKHEIHVVVFFIFIVSNVGGLLSPLGDPPLFLGYLMGVPFWWPLRLFPIWFFVVMSLLGIFAAIDSYFYLNDPDFRGPMKVETKMPFKIIGKWNLALIPVLTCGLLINQFFPTMPFMWQEALRIFILVFVIYLSHQITPKQVETLNNFGWGPFQEVAIIFAGIFATMFPAIKYLEAHTHQLGLSTPWSFFWLTGIISGVLDNAPTFAAFFALAQGFGKDVTMVTLSNGQTVSESLLVALTCGAVFFGALTYIGNGPNLLVKAVAEEEHLRVPSFFGYMLWSIGFLLPVLFVTAILFFE